MNAEARIARAVILSEVEGSREITSKPSPMDSSVSLGMTLLNHSPLGFFIRESSFGLGSLPTDSNTV